MTFRLSSVLGFAIALTAVLLGACASSPAPTKHYTLPAMATSTAPTSPVVILQLAPIRLASHLDTRGLIYQDTAITLDEAHAHVWAQNLREQLGRVLRQQLSSQLPALQTRPADMMLPTDPRDYQLRVDVEQFQGRYDGFTIISGSWTLRDRRGALLETQPFLIEQALAENGHAAMVRGLAQAWQLLAMEIAEQLGARDPRLRSLD